MALTKNCRLQHDRNIKYWKDRGYYDHHPNYNKSKVGKVARLVGNRQDHGLIKERYNIMVNPPQKRVMLLQYPNREPGQAYCDQVGQKPLELRIKPKCGLVEVDIPVDIHGNYDKEQGLDYGSVMRKSKLAGYDCCYGMPGGLGIGSGNIGKTRLPKRPKGGPKSFAVGTKMSAYGIGTIDIGEKGDGDNIVPEGPAREKLMENFDDANNKGHVMNKITLGGRAIPFGNGDPIYTVATFSDGSSLCCSSAWNMY